MNKFQINMNQHNHYLKFPQVPSVGENVTNKSNALNLNNFNLPAIKLPFPPTIRASDIAQKRLRSRICSKSPNAFFIYRKAFVEQLSIFYGNNKLKMTEVSRLVSSYWKNESEHVKVAYENIAKEVEQELNDIRNKDLVYTDDFDTGNRRRRKNKNHKRSRRPNSEFGSDAFFMNLKGNANFNISTLDFSVKPSDNNDNSNNPSLSSSPSQSVSSFPSEESVNYEESSSSDDSSIPDAIITTFDNDYNEYNDNDNDNNIQQLQQNNFEFTSPISEVGFDFICDPNLLNPISPPTCNLYNHYIAQYPQSEEELNSCESFLNNNNNENENASLFHPDYYLDYLFWLV